LNLERKSEIQAFHPFTMKKNTTIKKKTMQKTNTVNSEKKKHLLQFTLHYYCGSEEKSTSVRVVFMKFPEGRKIQRYLHCAVNEKKIQ